MSYSRDIHGNIHTRTEACNRLACVPVDHSCEAYRYAEDGCPAPQTHEPRPPEPHVCPEVVVVDRDLVRALHEVVKTIEMGITDDKSPYDTVRMLLDKMEKGFLVP